MYRHKCRRCLKTWQTVLEKPLRCGWCGTSLWDKAPQRKAGAGRPKGAKTQRRRSEEVSSPALTTSSPPPPHQESFSEEVNRLYGQVMAENPEADPQVILRQVTDQVRRQRKEKAEQDSGQNPESGKMSVESLLKSGMVRKGI